MPRIRGRILVVLLVAQAATLGFGLMDGLAFWVKGLEYRAGNGADAAVTRLEGDGLLTVNDQDERRRAWVAVGDVGREIGRDRLNAFFPIASAAGAVSLVALVVVLWPTRREPPFEV